MPPALCSSGYYPRSLCRARVLPRELRVLCEPLACAPESSSTVSTGERAGHRKPLKHAEFLDHGFGLRSCHRWHVGHATGKLQDPGALTAARGKVCLWLWVPGHRPGLIPHDRSWRLCGGSSSRLPAPPRTSPWTSVGTHLVPESGGLGIATLGTGSYRRWLRLGQGRDLLSGLGARVTSPRTIPGRTWALSSECCPDWDARHEGLQRATS